jgi:phosphoesterase RecJ-like protein
MRIRETEFALRIREYNNILYLCHRNADPDAVGSAFALSQAFGGTLGAAEDLSRLGQAVARAIGAQIILNPNPENFDLVVVVDASVPLQLGTIRLAKYAVVDHHLDKDLSAGALFYIQRPANSTAEIVWSIIRKSGATVSRTMALGLLAGIIADTGRFRRGSAESFQAVADILETAEISYEEAQAVLSFPTEFSQRIAVLKAASRAHIEHNDLWIIATTEVNAFEGPSAMALVELGADVAFAAGRHNNATRISARAGREAIRAGLNLADLLSNVAASMGGEGGGHKGAAAMEVRKDSAALLDLCRERALQNLGEKS